MVEKVVPGLISEHCEANDGFHPGQYGCRVKRSAVDAVGVVIAQTQEAWSRGVITGALLTDAAAAFPSVARGCLLRKMCNAGVDECLIRWTDSFMRNRRVAMSQDGQDGEGVEVTTGLPQGSPVSPVLFAIYIAEIYRAVESRVEDSRGISFVDDVTWLVERVDVNDVVRKLDPQGAGRSGALAIQQHSFGGPGDRGGGRDGGGRGERVRVGGVVSPGAGRTECFLFFRQLFWRNGGRRWGAHYDGRILRLRGWMLDGDGICILCIPVKARRCCLGSDGAACIGI